MENSILVTKGSSPLSSQIHVVSHGIAIWTENPCSIYYFPRIVISLTRRKNNFIGPPAGQFVQELIPFHDHHHHHHHSLRAKLPTKEPTVQPLLPDFPCSKFPVSSYYTKLKYYLNTR